MTDTEHKPYATVNAVWPDTIPAMTGPEAITAFKRLYRIAMGRRWKGKVALTSGRRYNWTRRVNGIGPFIFFVNPQGHHMGGWKDLCHDLSHFAHQNINPKRRPHDFRHAFIEKTLIEHVVRSGWLEGKLRRPEKPKPEVDKIDVRAQRVEARIKTWTTKEKRAKTALKKLRAKQAYYAKKIS